LEEQGQSDFVLCCVSNWAKSIELFSVTELKWRQNIPHMRSIWDHIALTKNPLFLQEFKYVAQTLYYLYTNSEELITHLEFVKELHDTTLVHLTWTRRM